MSFYPGVNEGVVAVGGIEVKYYDTGNALDGRVPIVLLHGTGGSAQNNFWALFPMLSFRHRVIALDFVDDIPAAYGPLDVNHFASQAEEVIRHLAPGQSVNLVGYSLGAVVAAVVAADHPELVESLVLVAGWIKTDVQQELRNRLWHQLNEIAPAALGAFMTLTAFSSEFLASKSKQEIDKLVSDVQNGPDRERKMKVNRTVDISDKISEIHARTLVIGCTHDQMVPIKHSQSLFGAIENARFAQISSGHAVVHERPAELFKHIDDFATLPAGDHAGKVLEPIHS